MDLGQNIGSSFGYARKLFSDIGRYIILIILDIIPIVNLIVLGYAGRVVQTTPASEDPPKLERYGDMFIEGLKIVVATVVYMIIPIIIFAVGAGSLIAGIFGFGGGAPAAGFALLGFGGLLILVGVIVAIIMAIFSITGIAHMLKTNNFGKAFAFGEIREIIGRIGWGSYIVWVIVVVLIAVVWGWIVGALNIGGVPLGTILGVLAGPFLATFYGRTIGLIYNEGAPEHLRSYPTVAPPPPPSSGYVPPPPAAPAQGNFCINCGARLQPQNKFCPSCGQPVK